MSHNYIKNLDWYPKLVEYNALTDRSFDAIDLIYELGVIYPAKENVFRAFKECPYNRVRVVMIFQDPYHDGRATGISTAVENNPLPVTLKNIFKEITKDYGKPKTDPDLLHWCNQGVLMLNAALTVERKNPGSHLVMWENFTKNLLKGLSLERKLVWVLFGKKIQQHKEYIKQGIVIDAVHPAAEAYSGGTSGFFGSGVFKSINNNLNSKIVW